MLRSELPEAEDAKIAAVEYMDRRSMDLIEARKETMTKSRNCRILKRIFRHWFTRNFREVKKELR